MPKRRARRLCRPLRRPWASMITLHAGPQLHPGMLAGPNCDAHGVCRRARTARRRVGRAERTRGRVGCLSSIVVRSRCDRAVRGFGRMPGRQIRLRRPCTVARNRSRRFGRFSTGAAAQLDKRDPGSQIEAKPPPCAAARAELTSSHSKTRLSSSQFEKKNRTCDQTKSSVAVHPFARHARRPQRTCL